MSNNLYTKTSPYFVTDITNNNFLDVMVNRRIPMVDTDILWTITPAYIYRPDKLADDLYADTTLYWVFAQRNPNVILDPYFDFLPGVMIYRPKLTTLKQALGIS